MHHPHETVPEIEVQRSRWLEASFDYDLRRASHTAFEGKMSKCFASPKLKMVKAQCCETHALDYDSSKASLHPLPGYLSETV